MVIPFQRSEGCSKKFQGFLSKKCTLCLLSALNAVALVLNLSQPSKASVRGMSYQDLLRHPDFTRAVKAIAEQCSVNVDIAKLNVKEGDLSNWRPPRMPPSGQSRRFDRGLATSGLPPMNGHSQTAPACRKSASIGSARLPYSITSSAAREARLAPRASNTSPRGCVS